MMVFILILVAIFLIGLGFGATVWFIFRRRQPIKSQEPDKETAARETLPFRWNYIIAPIAIFLLSIILSVLFYGQLPAEVGYQFKSDGTPARWLSREMAMVLMLAPQFFLILLSGGIIWGVTKLGILSKQTENLGIKPQRILSLIGNIGALPQIVIGFVILDIFTYNSYQIHILPTWAFLLILGIATIALGLLLVFIILKARRQVSYQPEESRSDSD